MATHSVFFDGPRVPSLASYCASPTCGTGSPCNACRVEDGLLCQVCRDANAVAISDDGTPSGLAICAACRTECRAEATSCPHRKGENLLTCKACKADRAVRR